MPLPFDLAARLLVDLHNARVSIRGHFDIVNNLEFVIYCTLQMSSFNKFPDAI